MKLHACVALGGAIGAPWVSMPTNGPPPLPALPLWSRLWVRMFASFLLALLLFGAVAGLVTLWLVAQRAEALGETRRQLFAEAREVAATGRRADLIRWLRAAPPRDSRHRLLIVDESGAELLGRPLPARGPRAQGPPGPPGARLLHGPARIVTVDGSVYRLILTAPRRPRLGPFALPETRAAQLLLALAIAAAVSALLARTITRPVAALERATRELAAGRLDARVGERTARRRDEIGRLAAAFDQMAARLEESTRARERLLRDVSHELRSPLARMRVALDLAERDAQAPHRHHERIALEIGRVDALLGQILDVERLGAGPDVLHRGRIELGELLGRIVADAAFEAAASGRSVELEQKLRSSPFVDADPHWLGAAFENLVRNAVRYTRPGAPVRVVLEQLDAASGSSLEVRVEDGGPGVPEAELARIFEPFHRVESGRERESGGVGLGLAIAARVTAAHGGTIAARNRPEGGLVIVVRLPPAAAPPQPGTR